MKIIDMIKQAVEEEKKRHEVIDFSVFLAPDVISTMKKEGSVFTEDTTFSVTIPYVEGIRYFEDDRPTSKPITLRFAWWDKENGNPRGSGITFEKPEKEWKQFRWET